MPTAASSWEVRPVHALWQPCLWLCSKALVDAWEKFMIVSALREAMGAWYSMQQMRSHQRPHSCMPGAGIGVALSSVIQLAGVMKTYLIWVAKEPEATYGAEVLRLVHAVAPERRLIIDTACQERPDIPALVAERAGLEQADTVYIVSNPQLTDQIWHACDEKGIAAFGPIWDS